MPTPRNVLGVNSSGSTFQSCQTALRTSGVVAGTTLHSAAPSTVCLPANFSSRSFTPPLSHASVGTSACLMTWRSFARPRCVFVLPMSNRRIISQSNRGRDIAADDVFEVPMFRAQQQRAIIIERFRAAMNAPITDLESHRLADGGAMLRPLIRDGFKFAGAHPRVVTIQLTEDFNGEIGAGNRSAAFDFQRRRNLAQIRWKLRRSQIDIHTNAKNDMLNAIQFRAQFRENARGLFSVEKNVIGPFDFRF